VGGYTPTLKTLDRLKTPINAKENTMDNKQHACAFAAWLWYYVSEKDMALKSWEELYDMWQEALK
jgi:hypothetical protein